MGVGGLLHLQFHVRGALFQVVEEVVEFGPGIGAALLEFAWGAVRARLDSCDGVLVGVGHIVGPDDAGDRKSNV